jgi:hypothetical protein
MSLRRYLPSLIAATILLPALAYADDQVPPAYSRAGKLDLCAGVGDNNPSIDPAICKKNGYDKVSDELDRALQAALSKAPANVQPLLKRDQGFFGESSRRPVRKCRGRTIRKSASGSQASSRGASPRWRGSRKVLAAPACSAPWKTCSAASR